MVKIDLITGFLGSGKTTFIKKYAKYLIDQGLNIGILENDFGAVNVDMMLLQDIAGEKCTLEMVAGGCDKDCHRRRFRTKLIAMGMCGYDRVLIEPSGIFDMDEFFDGKRGHETFAGEGFSLELIRRYGIRVSELGDYSMEYDLKTPEQQAEVCNVVRFAIDRSRLTKEHLDYVIAAVKALYEDRENIPNMRIVWGHNLPMRHFHAFLEPYANEEK